MQVILIIVSILMFMISVIVPVGIATDKYHVKWYHYILIGMLLIVLATSTTVVADRAANYNEPKAIDVYREKTTLKITYVDSIPQDTIVIFK